MFYKSRFKLILNKETEKIFFRGRLRFSKLSFECNNKLGEKKIRI